MNEINIKIGNRIRQLRNSVGISQEDLAYACGLNRNFIGQLERFEKSASVNTIDKIAKALGISLHEFFDFDEIDMTNDVIIKLAAMLKDLNNNQLRQTLDLVERIITLQKS